MRRNNTMKKIKNHQQLQLAIKRNQLIQFQIDFCFNLKQIFDEFKDVQDDDTLLAVNVYWMLHDIIENVMNFGDMMMDYMDLTKS